MRAESRKYQVFISSTYEDLRDERQAITWAVMKLNCIPMGMEAFVAQDDRGWEIIQDTIDDSDYYVLVIAGRYGHFEPEWNQSWTHREYEYARLKQIPILVFIREPQWITQDKAEADSEQFKRLKAFKEAVKRHYVAPWTTAEKLVSEIVGALSSHIQNDIRHNRQRPGWHRTNVLPRVDLVKKTCPMENWVIISQLSAFTDALRGELKKKIGELGITQCPEFKGPPEKHNLEYLKMLKQFLDEAPDGSWLFTNYPEDAHNAHSQADEDRLISDLLRQNKRMICFESGHNLHLRAAGETINPVGVIETDARNAIERLIIHMTDNVWRERHIRQIEIVSMMGPLAANTQARATNYLDFFASVQHGLKRDAYQNVREKLARKVLCTTVTRSLPTWLPKDCTPEIEEFLEFRVSKNELDGSRLVQDEAGHVTFVCGNDDLAVLVYEMVKMRFPVDVKSGLVSFVGFDGMECMEKLKQELKEHRHLAATAKVNFEEMVRVAALWLKDGNVPEAPRSVSPEVVG